MTRPLLQLLPGLPPSPDGARAEPFASSFDHLLAEVERLDLLVRMAVFRARRAAGEDGVRSFSVTEEDIDAVLGRPVGQPPWASTPPAPALAKVQALAEQKAADIARRLATSEARGIPLRLPALAARFGLTRFETEILLIALLPEVDLRYERLFVYLNDDLTRCRPAVDTTLGLLCRSFEERIAARSCFSPHAPLRRHALIHVGADASERQGSLLRATIQADPRIVEHLHGSDAIDPQMAAHAKVVEPRTRLDDLLLPAELERGLTRFVRAHEHGAVVYLQGPRGAGKAALAEALCHELGVSLVRVDAALLAAAGDDAIREAGPRVVREARLRNAAIHWDGIGPLLEGGTDRASARAALLAAVEAHAGLVFLTGAEPWEPVGALFGRAFLRVELPRLGLRDQAELWTRELAGAGAGDVDVEVLASMFRLNGGQIREAVARARAQACFREGGGPPTLGDLGRACQLTATRKLSSLARNIPPQHRWSDLVLPAERLGQIQEICLHVKHRSRVLGAWGFDKKLSLGKGLAALFAGPPGTGKTMAAGVVAGELGLELYQIDLSTVVSKYIGETEKHLAQLFADAEASNAVLLFDEADALFGKRTATHDAHDRYANIETSYLLQRIEAYEGVVLLSTNFARNMDEAFLRRLQFIVEFPLPGVAERLRIWQQIWPPDMPKSDDLDAEFLARKLEVSGGHIRNMALAAAFLAADEGAKVGMRHVLHAARRELQKMGKMVDRDVLAYPQR